MTDDTAIPRAIQVDLWPLEETRTPTKSCVYQAACEIAGIAYSARSRNGASNELARVLVAAGIADQAMEVRQRGTEGQLTWSSFHAAARWTYEESAGVPLRRIPYARVEASRERARTRWVEADLPGSSDAPAVADRVEASDPAFADSSTAG